MSIFRAESPLGLPSLTRPSWVLRGLAPDLDACICSVHVFPSAHFVKVIALSDNQRLGCLGGSFLIRLTGSIGANIRPRKRVITATRMFLVMTVKSVSKHSYCPDGRMAGLGADKTRDSERQCGNRART